jgi:hypothetical protein
MKSHIFITLAMSCLVVAAGATDLSARGFGGFHGAPHPGGMPHMGGAPHVGGFAGGPHPGGAPHLGGFQPGGMNLGGMRPGGTNFGGLRPGGGSPGGLGGLHGFNPGGGLAGGLPAGGIGRDSLGAGGFGGGGANRFGAGVGRSPLGGGGAAGGLGGTGFDRPPTRGGVNSFLGLPSDAGLHGVSRAVEGPGGMTAERGAIAGPRGGVAAGGAVRGPLGGTAVRGAAVGPRGNVVGGRAARGPYGNAVGQGFAAGPRGLRTISATSLHTGATAVRQSFHGRDLYSRGWYARYPGAWAATGWGVGYAWRAATWDALGSWFDYDDEPVYYDYGNNVTYQDNSVYVNGQDVGTTEQYYDQAQDLATTGAQADASTDEQWMPLGIFAMSKAGHDSANMDFQLAVNKDGMIRGNYTNPVSNSVEPISGSVDKKTQRAAWSVGSNTDTVIETGIYNLTKDEAPALVHFGADRTEQWILVRIKQDAQATDGQSQ